MELANMRSSRPTLLYLAALAACSACMGDASAGAASGPESEAPGSEVSSVGALGASLHSAIKTVDVSPTYFGTRMPDGRCSARKYHTLGYEPMPDASVPKRPLFLYFAGTTARYDALAPQNVSMAMAARGFVALSVEYDNTASALTTDHVAQLECLFSPEQPQSLIAAACGLPNVDCDLGIATWGHSLGALIAHLAANYDSRVSAAWLTGYAREDEGYFPAPFISTLPFERTRVVNGEADFSAPTTAPAMNHVTGMSDAECPADGRSKCLRADGSGWIVVRKADLALPRATADHCWFDRPSCLSTTIALDPNWIDASSTKDFALENNADWLAETAQRH